MADTPLFPDIDDSDTDDVSWSLETGRSMWQQGEMREALRWLKRAAESAEEAGNDTRSLSLAKAAADLRAHVEKEMGPLSEYPPQNEGNGEAAQAPKAALPRPKSLPSRPAPAAATPLPPPAAVPTPSAPPVRSASAAPSASSAPAPLRAPSTRPATTKSTAPRPLDRRDAVRVAVQPLTDRPGFYVVRPLGIGEHAAKGLREALLVAIDEDPVLPD